jgi:phosphoenolpyruvate carboxylase
MSRFKKPEQAFKELVETKFHLYNSLFLTLPFEDLPDLHTKLPIFANFCADQLENGKSPTEVIEMALGQFKTSNDQDSENKALFKILQLVERQVVLFDAIEDAAFTHVNKLTGKGTLTDLLNRVHDNNLEEDLSEIANRYRTRIVLTAHPTQFYPDAVLGVITDLASAISKSDTSHIRRLMLQLGLTKFKNSSKPTPHQEALSIIWYLKSVFYKTIPVIQKHVETFLKAELPPLVEMGFWPAGDRDGNPFVKHDTTLAVSRELKVTLIRLYLEDLRDLRRRLTFEGVWDTIDEVVRRLNRTLESCFLSTPDPDRFVTADEIIEILQGTLKVINEKNLGLFAEELEDYIRTLRVFGFHFATMDIRQDSGIHEETVGEITEYLRASGNLTAQLDTGKKYSDLNEDERLNFLTEVIKTDHNIDWDKTSLPTPLSVETIKSIQVTKTIQAYNGDKGVHRYIISNSQGASHLFEALALNSLSGTSFKDINLDIVPLFETIDDLKNSREIMEFLYNNELYKSHLASRSNEQTIMLGFSDGTKDGGYLAANWSILNAKRNLTEVSRKYGIHVTFFDGRGGPPARGGGNTHKFYRSLGSDVEHDRIHITIQGQTISSNFGTYDSNLYNLEQLVTSGLESFLFHRDQVSLDDENTKRLVAMSAVARDKYLLLKNHPLFTAYLEEMTPLKYYDRLNVGSRPAKRKKTAALKLSDLRAIPFVGSWSQIKQNIPGFYGLGTALEQAIEEFGIEVFQQLYKSNLFFSTLLDNAMQSLSKTNLSLTEYLGKHERFGEIWHSVNNEAQLTKNLLIQISQQEVLLGKTPVVRSSVVLREKIILPLLTIQQYALEKIRIAEENDVDDAQTEVYRKIVVKSLAANINASRNSA